MNNLSVIHDPKMINSPDPAEVEQEEYPETSTDSLIEEMEAFLQQHEENNTVSDSSFVEKVQLDKMEEVK